MNALLKCLAVMAVATVAAASDPAPKSSSTPVFQLFELQPAKPDSPKQPIEKGQKFCNVKGVKEKLTYNVNRPLISVSRAQSIAMDAKKTVLIELNAADAKRMAELAGKYRGRTLMVGVGGKIFEPIDLPEGVDHRYIGWRGGAIPEYLRQRFQLKEIKPQ